MMKTVVSLLLSLLPLLLVVAQVAQAELVEYEWTVTPRRSVMPYSPDCYINRDMLLINDSNPGPVLRAKVGDTVRVTIHNHSPTEALSIHYHGISMWQQPYSDGVQTSSQCNVGPLQSQVNEFQITKRDVGLHYYHGHTSLDRQDGLQGAIIIEDPESEDEIALKQEYDEERIIMLQDWYHRAGPSNRIGLDSEPFIWLGNAQSFLINGKGHFEECLNETTAGPNCAEDCSLANYTSAVDVEPGKTYLVHILNVASLVPVNFGIANHNLTVVGAEGTIVGPRISVENLDIGVAQRYSVLMTADQSPDQSYWMETIVRFRSGGVNGRAYLSYNGSPLPDNDNFPTHPDFEDVDYWEGLDGALTTKNPQQYDEYRALTDPVDKSMILVGTQLRRFEDNRLRWAVNNISQTFPAVPVVFSAYQAVMAEGAKGWPETDIPEFLEVPLESPTAWNYTETLQDEGVSTFHGGTGATVSRLEDGQIVQVVMQNTRALNGAAEFHSWHMHGHSFWVVGEGIGNFDPETDPDNFNLVNPIRRDTLSLLPVGWTAIRFVADNPGAWPFHCTMTPHAVMGMGLVFVTSPEKLPPPPPGVTSCFQLSLNPDDALDALECPVALPVPTTNGNSSSTSGSGSGSSNGSGSEGGGSSSSSAVTFMPTTTLLGAAGALVSFLVMGW